MNMFPNIHPFVSSLWLISTELYPKQPEALRPNGHTKGLIPRALWTPVQASVASVVVALWQAGYRGVRKELSGRK